MIKTKKVLTLKLTKIRYSGDYVGPNFSISFKLDSSQGKTNKRIYNGKEKKYNEEILKSFLDKNISLIQLKVFVSESDPVYDDIGKNAVKVDVSKVGIKKVKTSVLVEGRVHEKGKLALLELSFDVVVDFGIRYVNETSDGWLNIKLESGEKKSLPSFLKVSLLDSTKERDYFVILEGYLRGKKANVLSKGNGLSHLEEKNPQRKQAKLKLYLSKKILWIVGLGKFNVAEIDEGYKLLKVGKYDVEIPSGPHGDMDDFKKHSKFAMTWFRVGYSGDRFIHIGHVSRGCVTIKQVRSWTSISRYLLKSRKDEVSVGVLEVKK